MINYQKESVVNILYKSAFLVAVFSFVFRDSNAQLKLQPLVGYGIQSMKYDYGSTDIKGSGGLNIGADLFYYINDNIAVGSGVRFSTYKTMATLDSYESTSSGTDVDGDSYEATSTLSGVSEKYTQSTIEIPLLGRYQKWLNGSVIVFGTTGPVFIIPGSSNTDIESGSLSTTAYYEEWNLTVDEASEYDYGTSDISGSSSGNAKFSLAWDVEIGAEYFLNKRMNLSFTAFYQPGLTSFVSSTNSGGSFAGTMVSSGAAKLSKFGIRFGLSIDLSPPEKQSLKSIR